MLAPLVSLVVSTEDESLVELAALAPVDELDDDAPDVDETPVVDAGALDAALDVVAVELDVCPVLGAVEVLPAPEPVVDDVAVVVTCDELPLGSLLVASGPFVPSPQPTVKHAAHINVRTDCALRTLGTLTATTRLPFTLIRPF